MERRKRRKFSPEFKAEAVQLVRAGTKSLPQVAKLPPNMVTEENIITERSGTT